MQVSLELSDNQVALLQGAALALPQIVAAVPLGLLADRRSRVRVLFVVAILNIVGTLLTAISSDFSLLLLSRAIIGFAVAATSPAALSLIADLYPPAQRGRATMVVHIGGVGGLSAAFALGGTLLVAVGPQLNGWRWAMVGMTVPLVLVALGLLALREPSRAGVSAENPSAFEAINKLWGHRGVIAPLMSGWILVQVGDIAALVWAAPTISRNFNLSPDRVGEIMATLLLVSGILGPIAGGVMADLAQRTGGPRRTLAVLATLALMTLPASLFPLSPGVAISCVLLLVFVTIGLAIGTMTMALSIVVIPNALRGVCVSLYIAAGGLFGIGFAPIAVSLLSSVTGGHEAIGKALAIVGFVTGVLGTAMFVAGRRYLSRNRLPCATSTAGPS
jgi:predicted MFS family arabinose efflux permease